MKNVKALFIDCDGVLYDKKQCTNQDMIDIGFGKTFEQYHIPFEAFNQKHAELKQQGIRGVWNSVLALCNEHHVSFKDFAANMVQYTDYTRISKDMEMLALLKRAGIVLPIYIVTNNIAPHLNKIFACLNGGKPFKNVQKELNIHFITIENTLSDGFFHSKKMENQLTKLCTKIGYKPQEVLLLDDTESVRKVASNQGLQVRVIRTPRDTKTILRSVLHEKGTTKKPVFIRKTRNRIGR